MTSASTARSARADGAGARSPKRPPFHEALAGLREIVWLRDITAREQGRCTPLVLPCRLVHDADGPYHRHAVDARRPWPIHADRSPRAPRTNVPPHPRRCAIGIVDPKPPGRWSCRVSLTSMVRVRLDRKSTRL